VGAALDCMYIKITLGFSSVEERRSLCEKKIESACLVHQKEMDSEKIIESACLVHL
jgi:hypothetical protein